MKIHSAIDDGRAYVYKIIADDGSESVYWWAKPLDAELERDFGGSMTKWEAMVEQELRYAVERDTMHIEQPTRAVRVSAALRAALGEK